uniref:TTF-type domain-containing protein n=1 Tax=Lactuca sativa TaxID=4236 RepID=A0A9R1X1M4_LACSA|nr:hypothetical protein LSAT_V11C700350310 [Lactuca sativa]
MQPCRRWSRPMGSPTSTFSTTPEASVKRAPKLYQKAQQCEFWVVAPPDQLIQFDSAKSKSFVATRLLVAYWALAVAPLQTYGTATMLPAVVLQDCIATILLICCNPQFPILKYAFSFKLSSFNSAAVQSVLQFLTSFLLHLFSYTILGNMKTINHSFFKRNVDNEEIHDKNEEIKRRKASTSEPQPQEHENQQENDRNEATQSNPNEVVQADLKQLERDPAKRKQMWEYSVNLREEVGRAYMSLGPFQIRLKKYHAKGSKKHPRRFQYSWFNIFPNCLEYSPTTHASYCFICFIFNDKPSVSHGYDAFTVKGFDNWKNVNDVKNCAFLKHIGCSQHINVVAFAENLMNQEAHIENITMKQNEEQILKNRLRLKASIDTVRWLTFQACALQGHDESPNSKNHGNFLQLLKLIASYNDEVANVILEKAPYNSKYTSREIQKEILSIIANKVRKHIRSEVGDSYFCVMVDESQDESKKEQMVDVEGIIHERFLDLVHVRDTLSLTLKTNMWRQLLHYQFDVSKICGQGYNGAICASSKRHDELQKAKENEIEQLLELGEIESGKGLNQVGTLRREILGKTDVLSQALQKKSQVILNAMELVSATKESLNEFRNKGWDSLLEQIFNIDMTKNPKLSGVSTIADLCKGLVETQKRETYYLLDRVLRLILTLSVSTATTERGFSAMKIFKNRLRNTMSDDFLANNLVVYIEREIAENIDSKSVIDDFKDLKGRRAEL